MTNMAVAPSSVLFIEKMFLRPPPDPLRGVELFNLRLVEDFAALGFALTLPMHVAWKSVLAHRAAIAGLCPIWVKASGMWSTVSLWRRCRASRKDLVFVANVGNGLIPLLHLLRSSRVAPRLVLLAHREAAPRFVRALRRWPATIVAVNEQIARPFRDAGFARVAVDYGVMDADHYFPGERSAGGPVRCVVLGALENAWKGADTALAAFARLPPEVRERCELHLASYRTPPQDLGPGVVAHAWMSPADIPAFLRTMDIMICPSRDEVVMRETFSQAIVQGMLTALPVLASDLQIFREKLDKGGGRIFRDVEELARQLTELARDPALRVRLGAEARATAQARYCWNSGRFAQRHLITSATG